MRQQILGGLSLAGGILLWFGRGLTEHIFFGWMVHEMNSSAAAILEYGPPLVLALLGLYLLYRGSSATVSMQLHQGTAATPPVITPEVTTSQKEGKVFVGENITPRYLLNFFEEHTGIQASVLTKAFIGKWMRLSGPLGEVLATDPKYGAQLTFERDYEKPDREWFDYITVYMNFDELWIDRLAILRRGDQLTVIGEIKAVVPLVLTLHHCELVD